MFQAKLTPTAAGRALLAKAQQGAVMEFTGVKIGSGTLGSKDPDTLTNVITSVKTCPITSVMRQGEKTYIKFVLTQDNTSAYYLREMALMAKDPDSGEIAYMYANDGQNAELIPVPGATAFEREITIIVILSNVETVTASIQSGAYAGKDEFDAHVKDNVRHITSVEREMWNKKVGLGSDGKIPSSYLPEQEDPSLEDLDGTLGVKNGGTGKTSWSQNRILYASGAETLGQLAFPGAAGSILRQDKSGAPYWTSTEEVEMNDLGGTLSVENGGTGKTSWSQNRILYASDAGTLGQLAFPGAAGSILRQDKSGAPYWTSTEEMAQILGTATITTGTYTGTQTKADTAEGSGRFSSVERLIAAGRKIVLPFAPNILVIGESSGIIMAGAHSTSASETHSYVLQQGMSVHHTYTDSISGETSGYIAHLNGSTLYVGNNSLRQTNNVVYGLNWLNKSYQWAAIK